LAETNPFSKTALSARGYDQVIDAVTIIYFLNSNLGNLKDRYFSYIKIVKRSEDKRNLTSGACKNPRHTPPPPTGRFL